jgi:hypothetical protein
MAPLTAGLADSLGWLVDLMSYVLVPLALVLIWEIIVLLGMIITTHREHRPQHVGTVRQGVETER